jgi:hypothetical protein
MAATMTGHRPTIDRVPRAGVRLYQLRCTCGIHGRERSSRRVAEIDQADHIGALPRVPAAEQCQMPRQHDRRAWEPCLLCRDQQALPIDQGSRS